MPRITAQRGAFFDHIRSQGDSFAYLSSLPDPTASHHPFFEEEWLDFKGNPKDASDAKKTWSESTSRIPRTSRTA